MFQTIFSAILVYISTSIDYLFILLILFSQQKSNQDRQQIYLGQYLGTLILIVISLIIIYFVKFIPEDWMIGLLGFIPIFLGIRIFIMGEEEEGEAIVNKYNHKSQHFLFWTVTLITIASGGDNLGIYIPYFTTLDMTQIIIAIIIFMLCIPILCYLAQNLSKLPILSELLERYERFIVPIVFVGLGIYILIENQTFQHFF